MKKYLYSITVSIFLVFLFSCASVPPETTFEIQETPSDITESMIVTEDPLIEVPLTEVPVIVPEDIVTVIEIPELPTYIMGRGMVSAENMALFLMFNNPAADAGFVSMLMEIYVEEALFEGVNHDIAFAQMCLETGFLRFGGLVQPEFNNFAGLGAISREQPGLIFPDPRTGVQAHIQHLKAYGSEEPLNGELVNPRFRFVRRGSAPTYNDLAGTWAVDTLYGVKINSLLQRLYDFSF